MESKRLDQENKLPLLLISSLSLNQKKANPLRIINSDKADLTFEYVTGDIHNLTTNLI
jgi:hypothetical protein